MSDAGGADAGEGSAAALAALALLGNAFIWGTSWLPFRVLQERGAHALWSTVFVYLCGVALFLLWRPGALRQSLRYPALAALALSSGLTNICFNWAVTIGDVVRVVLLFYLMSAWSVLLAWALLGERPQIGALARLALALTGVSFVLKTEGAAWPWPESLADWLAIAGGFSFALTGVLLRRWCATPVSARTFAMFGGSALVCLLAATLAQRMGWIPPAPALAHWPQWLPWALALTALLLLGNLALQYGSAHLPAQTASLLMLSEVVFASVSSIALGAAALSARTLGGGGLILLAALLAVLARPARASG